MGLLTVFLAAGCVPDRSDAGTPESAAAAACSESVKRERQTGGDSLFADARGLVQSCPDAMAVALAALWGEQVVTAEPAGHLREVSALGVMDNPVRGEGSHPIPGAYMVQFRQMLETLRQSDSSSAVRSAARRFLLFLDYSRQQQQQQQVPPSPPPPSGS